MDCSWGASLPAIYGSLEALRAENREKVPNPKRSKNLRKVSLSGLFDLFGTCLRLQTFPAGKIFGRLFRGFRPGEPQNCRRWPAGTQLLGIYSETSSGEAAEELLGKCGETLRSPRLSVCRPAREPKTGNLQKRAPEIALGSALRNQGAVRSAPGSALQGFFLWKTTGRAPSRLLSGALWRAPRFLRALSRPLSGALLEVSLFWAL